MLPPFGCFCLGGAAERETEPAPRSSEPSESARLFLSQCFPAHAMMVSVKGEHEHYKVFYALWCTIQLNITFFILVNL